MVSISGAYQKGRFWDVTVVLSGFPLRVPFKGSLPSKPVLVHRLGFRGLGFRELGFRGLGFRVPPTFQGVQLRA